MIERSKLCAAKTMLVFDTLIELAAFSLICMLRYQIYLVELCLKETDDAEIQEMCD